MNKTAQSALEYLLTYGWAILIVIIVGASLYALGVFNPGTFTGKRVTGFTQFQVVDHKVDTDENLTIMFGNRLGKTIELGNVSAQFKNLPSCSSNTLGGDKLGPNDQTTVSIDCHDAWGDLSLRSSYSIIIDIEFQDPDSGLYHIDSGTLFGGVEED